MAFCGIRTVVSCKRVVGVSGFSVSWFWGFFENRVAGREVDWDFLLYLRHGVSRLVKL